ncbi:MAG: hemolysin family protein [Nitrospinota bacterium]|nr:hemolysin family protein [Nitrospinota bacterium]
MDTIFFFRVLFFIFLLFLSACFSGTETSFFSLSKSQIGKLRNSGSTGFKIAFLLEDPRRLITSILICNEIVNIAASSLFMGTIIFYFGSGFEWLVPCFLLPVLMIFGEITPKSFAARFPEKSARFLVYPVSFFAALISPLRNFCLFFANNFLSLLGVKSTAKENVLNENEFLNLVEIGVSEGEVEEIENKIIQNVFSFHDKKIETILVSRDQMLCWDNGLNFGEILKRVKKVPFSRIPVFNVEKTEIIGILYIKDFLRSVSSMKGIPDGILSPNMLREPLFVSIDTKLDILFHMFRRRRIHIAIVLDRFRKVVGMVTMTDLLEEIFGEIRQEQIEQ